MQPTFIPIVLVTMMKRYLSVQNNWSYFKNVFFVAVGMRYLTSADKYLKIGDSERAVRSLIFRQKKRTHEIRSSVLALTKA